MQVGWPELGRLFHFAERSLDLCHEFLSDSWALAKVRPVNSLDFLVSCLVKFDHSTTRPCSRAFSAGLVPRKSFLRFLLSILQPGAGLQPTRRPRPQTLGQCSRKVRWRSSHDPRAAIAILLRAAFVFVATCCHSSQRIQGIPSTEKFVQANQLTCRSGLRRAVGCAILREEFPFEQ